MSVLHHVTGPGKPPTCGQTGTVAVTTERSDTTCKRCLSVLALRDKREQDGLSAPQRVAIDQERRFTVREALAYIDEGDLDEAIFRMQRGFARQVRLAGLDRILRESLEQEKELIG